MTAYRSIPSFRGIPSALAVVALLLAPDAAEAGAAVGDTYVYRLVNGYNQQVRGHIQHRVERIDTHGMETQIIEIEWYAPALKRAVRVERRSEWIEPARCGMSAPCDFHGDWDVLELSEVRRAKP